MKNLSKGIPQSVRETLKAAIPLMIGIALLAVGGNIAYSQISALRDKISLAQKDQTTLSQKLKVLSSVSTTAAQEAEAATSALPEGNPALVVVSQLKNLASSKGIILSAMKSSAGSDSGGSFSDVTISFTIDGPRASVLSFLQDISQIAPLTSVVSVGINEFAGVDDATVNLRSYWAPFPKTISPINQAITDLNSSEKQTLSEINNLTQPTFAQVTPLQGNTNPNPFGQ